MLNDDDFLRHSRREDTNNNYIPPTEEENIEESSAPIEEETASSEYSPDDFVVMESEEEFEALPEDEPVNPQSVEPDDDNYNPFDNTQNSVVSEENVVSREENLKPFMVVEDETEFNNIIDDRDKKPDRNYYTEVYSQKEFDLLVEDDVREPISESGDNISNYKSLGNYDADSGKFINKETGKSMTMRLTGLGNAYPQAPELRDDWGALIPEGVKATVFADHYRLGRDLNNPPTYFPDGKDEYLEYRAETDKLLVERGLRGVRLTGQLGKYKRAIYTEQRDRESVGLAEYLVNTGNAVWVKTSNNDLVYEQKEKTDLLKGFEEARSNPELMGNLLLAFMDGSVELVGMVLKAPRDMTNFFVDGEKDYFAEDGEFSKKNPNWGSVARLVNKVGDFAEDKERMLKAIIDYNPTEKNELLDDFSKAWEDEKYVSGVSSAILDNPLGVFEMAFHSFLFGKAIISGGMKLIPPLALGLFTENSERSREIFKYNYNRDPNEEEKGLILFSNFIGTAVAVFGISKLASYGYTADSVRTAFRVGGAGANPSIFRGITSTALEVTKSFSGEVLSEVGEEFGAVFGGVQDLKNFSDGDKKSIFIAGASGLAGAIGTKPIDSSLRLGYKGLSSGTNMLKNAVKNKFSSNGSASAPRNSDTISYENEERTDGSIHWRANNPLGIPIDNSSRDDGAVDNKDGIAVFPNQEAGINAGVNFLNNPRNRERTLGKFLSDFQDTNNYDYIPSKKDEENTNLDTKIKDLPKEAIQSFITDTIAPHMAKGVTSVNEETSQTDPSSVSEDTKVYNGYEDRLFSDKIKDDMYISPAQHNFAKVLDNSKLEEKLGEIDVLSDEKSMDEKKSKILQYVKALNNKKVENTQEEIVSALKKAEQSLSNSMNFIIQKLGVTSIKSLRETSLKSVGKIINDTRRTENNISDLTAREFFNFFEDNNLQTIPTQEELNELVSKSDKDNENIANILLEYSERKSKQEDKLKARDEASNHTEQADFQSNQEPLTNSLSEQEQANMEQFEADSSQYIETDNSQYIDEQQFQETEQSLDSKSTENKDKKNDFNKFKTTLTVGEKKVRFEANISKKGVVEYSDGLRKSIEEKDTKSLDKYKKMLKDWEKTTKTRLETINKALSIYDKRGGKGKEIKLHYLTANNEKIKVFIAKNNTSKFLLKYKSYAEIRLSNLDNIQRTLGKDTQINVLNSEDTTDILPTDNKNLKDNALSSTENLLKTLRELSPSSIPSDIERLIKDINIGAISASKLFVDTTKNMNRGQFNSDNIVVETSQFSKTYGNEASASEVFAHELVHSITNYAIDLSAQDLRANQIVNQLKSARNKAERHLKDKYGERNAWKGFLPENSIDKAKEIEKAKKTYEYIFKGENSLKEFIAYSLTNKEAITLLKSFKVGANKETNNLWGWINLKIKNLLETISGSSSISSRKLSTYEAVYRLTSELSKYNKIKSEENVEVRGAVGASVFNFLDKIGNKPMEKLFDKWQEGLENATVPSLPENSSKTAKSKWLVSNFNKILFTQKNRNLREQMFKDIGITPDGDIMSIIRDMSNPDNLEKSIEKLGMKNVSIDQERENTETIVSQMVASNFNKKLTNREETVLADVIVRADISSLFTGKQNFLNVLDDISDVGKIETRLDKHLEVIYNLVKKSDRKWVKTQIENLGRSLITGEVGLSLSPNAKAIISEIEEKNTHQESLVELIDTAITYTALTNLDENVRKEFGALLKENRRGVSNIAFLHNSNIEKYNKTVPRYYRYKGYSKETFDGGVETKVVPTSEGAKMEHKGFKLVGKAQSNGLIDMSIYKSKYNLSLARNPHAIRFTNVHTRGVSISKMAMIESDTEKHSPKRRKEHLKSTISDLKRKLNKEILDIKSGKITTITGSIIPIFNYDGKIYDFEYMSPEKDKRSVFQKETSISSLLSRSRGNLQDLVSTRELNNATMEVLLEDEKGNGTNGFSYIDIKAHSSDPKIADMYNVLPDDLKRRISHRKDDGRKIAVRESMFSFIFGSKERSMMENKYMKKLTPDVSHKYIRLAEKIWKEVIQISKADIVIRTPAVFIGNFVSNAMYSVVQGANITDVYKLQLSSYRNLTVYLAQQEELNRLTIEEDMMGEKSGKIKSLKYELSINPVSDLMKAGMYQSIVEDLGKTEFKNSNIIARTVDKVLKKAPRTIERGIHQLYISEQTSLFKALTKATQMSDFIARASEYRLLKARGVPKAQAMEQILDAFVNYTKPSGSYEDYLNQMGLIMFSKYMKRIQRVVRVSGKKKSLNVLLSIFGQELLGNVEDIHDQTLLDRGWSNLQPDLGNHIMNMVVPTTLEGVLSND